jgi:PAS domain-containing protein
MQERYVDQPNRHGGEDGARPGQAVVTLDGRYLDADTIVLDLYGVTLDVLREKRIGDFSPPEFAELERQLWSLWVHLGVDSAEGGGTVVRADGRACRVWVALQRRPDGNVNLRLEPLDDPASEPPSLRVKTLLGQWREVERHLEGTPPEDPEHARLTARIEALRTEYRRRTGSC